MGIWVNNVKNVKIGTIFKIIHKVPSSKCKKNGSHDFHGCWNKKFKIKSIKWFLLVNIKKASYSKSVIYFYLKNLIHDGENCMLRFGGESYKKSVRKYDFPKLVLNTDDKYYTHFGPYYAINTWKKDKDTGIISFKYDIREYYPENHHYEF
jgi:hypothetical protein